MQMRLHKFPMQLLATAYHRGGRVRTLTCTNYNLSDMFPHWKIRSIKMKIYAERYRQWLARTCLTETGKLHIFLTHLSGPPYPNQSDTDHASMSFWRKKLLFARCSGKTGSFFTPTPLRVDQQVHHFLWLIKNNPLWKPYSHWLLYEKSIFAGIRHKHRLSTKSTGIRCVVASKRGLFCWN